MGVFKSKSQDVDLGLAVMEALAVPGQQYTCSEIGAVCGCSAQAIDYIQTQALKKLASKLQIKTQPDTWEAIKITSRAFTRSSS